MLARNLFAYGEQRDFFDDAGCIGWTRLGAQGRSGCAVVMSNVGDGNRRMFVGEGRRGEVWTDLMGAVEGEVRIGDDGWADFACKAIKVSVWTHKEAAGRDRFPVKFDVDIYRDF